MNKLSIFLFFACLILLARSVNVPTFAQFDLTRQADFANAAADPKEEPAAAQESGSVEEVKEETSVPEGATPTEEDKAPEETKPEDAAPAEEVKEETSVPEGATTEEVKEEETPAPEETKPEDAAPAEEVKEVTPAPEETKPEDATPGEEVKEEETPAPEEAKPEDATPGEEVKEEEIPAPEEAKPEDVTPAVEPTKTDKADELDIAAEKMNDAANVATRPLTQMQDLSKKLAEIKMLYHEKANQERESMAKDQLLATHGVMKAQEHALAPQEDIMFPAQMPRPGFLLNRFRHNNAPAPVRPQPSLYFNRPGRPTKIPNYFEADSDHKMYPERFYPAEPSKVERRRFMDRLERARSVIPNYRYIAQKEREALLNGRVF